VTEIEVGDVVLARSSEGAFYAVVRGSRLGRLVVDRCDGRPSGPVSSRDVVSVFKDQGAPGTAPATARLRPSPQLRLDLS
jgi:hypothetical protein